MCDKNGIFNPHKSKSENNYVRCFVSKPYMYYGVVKLHAVSVIDYYRQLSIKQIVLYYNFTNVQQSTVLSMLRSSLENFQYFLRSNISMH